MLKTIDEIIRRNPVNSGRHCNFYPESKSVGIKVYTHKDYCFSAFAGQLLLSKKGLAPKCWGMSKIDIIFFDTPYTYYYFFTEIVEVCGSRDYDDIQEFADHLEETSKVRFSDTCYFNAGRFQDGNFCVIDTCESITDLVSGVEI